MTSTSYNECASEPGCQVMSAAVAPEVIQALDDANLRVTSSMQPQTRALVEAQLDRLKTALTRRDLVNGRLAFAAVISAVSRAERANSSARPDLGALRLNLVPTARSLGLPVSDTEAETP